MHRRRPVFFVLLAGLAALSGCGGNGGSSLPPAGTSSSAPSTLQSIKISILIPAPSAPNAAARRPAYISSQTQSATISINGGTPALVNLSAGSAACTTSAAGRTCTTTVDAPIGPDVFAEKLYATPNGTGGVLSQGTTSQTIVAGQANTINLALDGVPSAVVLTLTDPAPAQGTAATIPLTVTVKDAAGAAIIGGDPFTSAITLTDSDTSGATSLSKAKLSSPNDAANLSVGYTGAALASPATFGATAAGVSAANVTPATLTPKSGSTGSVAFNDYATYGFDSQRTIYNPNSTAITPASLSALHVAWQQTTGTNDYNTQTQPILATNVGGHAGLLFVGSGGTGTVYAYDAQTGKYVWSDGLGAELYNCNEGGGATGFGVGGSAAYDAATKSLYIVSNYNTSLNGQGQNTLYHLDAATGHILGSVNFAPTFVGSSELNFSHTSVTLSGGIAYVGTAATCDVSSWRGRVAAIAVPSMQLLATHFTVWNGGSQPWGGGGVWGWGGVSLDSNGNVYTGVGNTDDGQTNHGTIVAPFQAAPAESSGDGDAFLQLSSDLSTEKATNHPINPAAYGSTVQAADLDLNGTPAIFTPNGAGCDALAAVQGKAGTLFLFDTTRVNSGPIAGYQLAPPAYTDAFLGDPAYSPATGLLYSPVPVGASPSQYHAGMIAINPGCGSPSVTWHTQFGPDSYDPNYDINQQTPYARSAPAVSAGGVVFVGTPCKPDSNGGCAGDLTISATAAARQAQAAERKPLICCAPPNSTTVGGAVWALNASTGEVLNGGLPLFTTPGLLRVPPTLDGNWLFVMDNAGDLYGLTIDPAYPAVALRYRTVDARSRGRWEPQPRPLTP